VRRLIEALPRWLYRFQPVFFCMALFGILLGMTGFGGLFAVVFTVVFFVPGQALFWLLSWLAVRRSSDKRLGFSTIPFSVYLLAVPLSYFTAPNTGPQFEETPSAAMRLASVMGLQLTRAVSNDLADVFFMVVQVAGALALLAALVDIVREARAGAPAGGRAGPRQPAQRGGKNERPEVETAPTSTGAAPPSTGVAPQDPSACG